MNRTVVTTAELAEGLASLASGWTGTTSELNRTVEFPSFLIAVRFIGEMAPIAERLDHHPDVKLSWRTVELTLATHSSGGVTAQDFGLAAELDPLIDRLSTSS
ncbi:4a-hydroxytetrahydrobiopterin dehydratase [Jatrophihabitans sp. DSM 45814]